MRPLGGAAELPDPNEEFLDLEVQLAAEVDEVKAPQIAARTLCLDIRNRLGDVFYETNRMKIEYVLGITSARPFTSYQDFTASFWTYFNGLR